MLSKNDGYRLIIKILLVVLFSVIIGFALLMIVYSLPLSKISQHVNESINIYRDNIIYEWAGGTRYSHLSNTMDSIRLNESICRPFNLINNALLNPRWKMNIGNTNISLPFIDKNSDVITYARYWHGYLIFIIPGLLFTHAGGLRMISMYIQFFLIIITIVELYKHNKKITYLFVCTLLFINPITTVLSFQDADILNITLITMILILKYNDKLLLKDRYLFLFLINGICVSYFDYLTYPLVAWGIPILTFLFINRNKYKFSTIVKFSLCWLIGYFEKWYGKWVLATILTDENIILDAFNAIAMRTFGEADNKKILFSDTLKIIWESVNDIPMLILYFIIFLLIFIPFIFNEKKRRLIEKKEISYYILLISISLSPFVWYFFVRNHTYYHPWMEYRELSIMIWGLSLTGYYILIDKNEK